MKAIYADWHTLYPNGGNGKEFPYLLEKILANSKYNKLLTTRRSAESKLNPIWNNILDYGCGKGGTIRWLKDIIKVHIDGYDPGHPDYNVMPQKEWDLVYTADVLEHIEKEDLNETITSIQNMAFQNIHIIDLTSAKKHLPDGRNAHVTLLPIYDWQEILEAPGIHEIVDMRKWSVPDKNFNKRERLCCTTREVVRRKSA